MREYDMDQELDISKICNILTYAGVLMEEKEDYNHDFWALGSGGEQHRLIREEQDSQARKFTTTIISTVESPSDTIEYSLSANYHHKNIPSPSTKSKDELWRECLEEAEGFYS